MDVKTNAQIAINWLNNRGYNINAVIGICCNIMAESGFDPTSVNSIGASGLFQELSPTPTYRAGMVNTVAGIEAQLSETMADANGGNTMSGWIYNIPGSFTDIVQGKYSAPDCCDIWGMNYERPGPAYAYGRFKHKASLDALGVDWGANGGTGNLQIAPDTGKAGLPKAGATLQDCGNQPAKNTNPATSFPTTPAVPQPSGNATVEAYVKWGEQFVGHGTYAMGGQWINTTGYSDCSRYVYSCLTNGGGFTCPVFSTSAMPQILTSLGFKRVYAGAYTETFAQQRGDIFILSNSPSLADGATSHTGIASSTTNCINCLPHTPAVQDWTLNWIAYGGFTYLEWWRLGT